MLIDRLLPATVVTCRRNTNYSGRPAWSTSGGCSLSVVCMIATDAARPTGKLNRRAIAGTTSRVSSVELARPPQNRQRQRPFDLVTGFSESPGERKHTQRGDQCRHQLRTQTLTSTAPGELWIPFLTFDQHQMLVMREQQNGVARADAKHRDQANECTDRQIDTGEGDHQHAAGQLPPTQHSLAKGRIDAPQAECQPTPRHENKATSPARQRPKKTTRVKLAAALQTSPSPTDD